MNQLLPEKTDGFRFEGGPLDGQMLAVPYPYPGRWRVPVMKISRPTNWVDDPPPKPGEAQSGYAEYHLHVLKNMETGEISNVFYKLASVPDWYKDNNAKKDSA
jgi:hypothetical protein